jgi:hypothetical protein
MTTFSVCHVCAAYSVSFLVDRSFGRLEVTAVHMGHRMLVPPIYEIRRHGHGFYHPERIVIAVKQQGNRTPTSL